MYSFWAGIYFLRVNDGRATICFSRDDCLFSDVSKGEVGVSTTRVSAATCTHLVIRASFSKEFIDIAWATTRLEGLNSETRATYGGTNDMQSVSSRCLRED